MTYPQTDNDLTRDVWHIMQSHKGYEHRIQRKQLAVALFGSEAIVTDDEGNWSIVPSCDRKVRDALSELPVVWNDGYFIPQTQREAQDYIASMRSRQASIGQRLRIVEDYLRAEREPVRVEQMKLMEVG